MKTKEMQTVIITEKCRKTHGQEKALEIAINEIRNKYAFVLAAKVNKNATIRILMTVENE